MKTVLVTGGCGFIGRQVVGTLLKQDCLVRVVDNLSNSELDSLAEFGPVEEVSPERLGLPQRSIQFIKADILDEQTAELACDGMQSVIHLAANTGVGPSVENPRLDCVTNVIGTLNYLEGCRKNNVGSFVLASSGATVGEVQPPIHEKLPPRPVSPYGASKLACEGYCAAYAQTFGLKTVALRFGNVYGPGSERKSSVVAKFIRHALNGERLPVFGDGRQTRDFIFIDDLVKAVLLAVTTEGIGGEIFQIATARETTIHELVEVLSDVLVECGCPRPEMESRASRLGDVARNFSDTSKAKRLLGWEAKVGLREGLADTIRWAISGGR